jgi:hypothetical protein
MKNEEHLTSKLFNNRKLSMDERTSMLFEENKKVSAQLPSEVESRLAYSHLIRQGAIFRKHLESSSGKEHIKVEEIDKHLLKGFLSYASRLYSTGEISQSAYVSLVTQAAESYVERLVELKLAQALEKYDLYLEEAVLR